jgi:hypothetical protein
VSELSKSDKITSTKSNLTSDTSNIKKKSEVLNRSKDHGSDEETWNPPTEAKIIKGKLQMNLLHFMLII